MWWLTLRQLGLGNGCSPLVASNHHESEPSRKIGLSFQKFLVQWDEGDTCGHLCS